MYTIYVKKKNRTFYFPIIIRFQNISFQSFYIVVTARTF